MSTIATFSDHDSRMGVSARGMDGDGCEFLRAIGPSLTGVSDPLLDPTLELHDINGVILASDDDWKDSQESEITASGLAPTDDRESAIETQLGAGNYTAIVRGKDNAVGVALVEIYDLGSSSSLRVTRGKK